MFYKQLILVIALCWLPWMLVGASNCQQNCAAQSIGIADNMVQSLTQALNAAKCSISDPLLWPRDYGPQVLRHGVQEDFDFVIVGAGTAGSVVASRLSENPNHKVLVLEFGGDPPLESEMFTQSNGLVRTQYTYNDYAEPNPNCCQSLIGERCFWTRGKMIGGGGGVNDNIFLPGNRENFDSWQQAGNPGWSWYDAKFYFAKARAAQGNESHPMGGLTLNNFEQLPEYKQLTDLIFAGAKELGVPRVNNFNDGTKIGYSLNISATIAQGLRMSTGKVYLAKVAPKRKNLKVLKNALATKIIFDRRNRAVGLDFTLQGVHKFNVRVRKEVLLSAGAFSSPQLLMLSGIGPREHLESLGIPVRKHLQVGANLRDHGLMPLFFKINRGNMSRPSQVENDNYQKVFDYFINKKGALATRFYLYGFINSDQNSTDEYPDLQLASHAILPVGDWSMANHLSIKPDIFQLVQTAAGQNNILLVYGALMKPKSSGHIRLRSTNPSDSPKIYNEYAAHAADKATVVRFVRYMQRMQNTESFKAHDIQLMHLPLPQCQDNVYNSDNYWTCYAKYFLLSCWHPAGTCKMGPRQDPNAVVDERLRVRGVHGVRVIDASIMPTITSGNTNGPTIMIAEKGSDMVKEDWRAR